MITKKRLQKLAGIQTADDSKNEKKPLKEGFTSFGMVSPGVLGNQFEGLMSQTVARRKPKAAKVDGNPQLSEAARLLQQVIREGISSELVKKIKNFLYEASTLPATNDSLDGPYTDIIDDQPMGVDKNINRELVEQELKGDDSPASREPSREDEEEAMSRHMGDEYPATAEEYAKMLNSEKTGSGFRLVEDPEHWDQYGIHTGKELAKYLAIEDFRDAFKEVHGVRPRHVDFDSLSIDRLESKTKNLWDQLEDDDEDDIPWAIEDDEDKLLGRS